MEIKNTLNEKIELVKEQYVIDQIIEDIHDLWKKSKCDYNAIAIHNENDERSKYDFLIELQKRLHSCAFDIVENRIRINSVKNIELFCDVKPRGLIVADTKKVIYGIFTESRKEILRGTLTGGALINNQNKHIQSIADNAINVFIKNGDVTIKQLILACPKSFGVANCDTLKTLLDPRFDNIKILYIEFEGEKGFDEAITYYIKTN